MSLVSLFLAAWLFINHLPLAFAVPHPAPGDDSPRNAPASQEPKVQINGAAYVGVSEANYGVDVFRGIRYAKAPIGSLRLQPPVASNNKGAYDASSFGAECFNLPPNPGSNPSEDCLFLNIYRPSLAAMHSIGKHWHNKHLPVMFWIHGGGFNDGNGSLYMAESLVQTSVQLKTPVIVVTINYRLSFFGFSAGKQVAANNGLNLGLLDQRLAMQWVHDNVKAFGGDENEVTIFGQSAGAASVGLQIVAYNGQAECLFRAAILESQYLSIVPPPTFPAYQAAWDAVVANVSCSTAADQFKCIQAVPAAQLFQAVVTIGATISPSAAAPPPWQPVIDGKFITDFPSKLLASGKFVKVPTIGGFTTDELTYVIPLSLNISTEAELVGLAELTLPFVPLTTLETIAALDSVQMFPNGFPEGGTYWKQATAIASDIFIRCPGRAFLRNMSMFEPTYKYRWNAILPAQLAEIPAEGVVHASDIPYIFGQSIATFYTYPAADLALSKIAQQAWISFAAYLDPNKLGPLGQGGSNSPAVTWPRYDTTSEQAIVFQTTDGVGGLGPAGGLGVHLEKDADDRPVCSFIVGNDVEFIRK